MSLLLTGSAAQAQVDPSFDLQAFNPSPHSEALFSVETGAVAPSFDFRLSLHTFYARRVLEFVSFPGEGGGAILEHRLDAQLAGAITLFDRLSVAVALPMVLYQLGTLPYGTTGEGEALSALTLRDLRFAPKVGILDQKRLFLDLALQLVLTFPTGNERAFAGERAVTAAPELDVSRRFGPVRLALNLGVVFRQLTRMPTFTVGPELYYRAGLGFDFAHFWPRARVELIGELFGRSSALTPFRGGIYNPLEWLAGVRYAPLKQLAFSAGAGSGLQGGYDAPRLRAFFGITFMPSVKDSPAGAASGPSACICTYAEDGDADGDGIAGKLDGCPSLAEDQDGFEDADGCPEVDDDKDGITDVADKCPREAEDKDGIADDDGCPEDDQDKDGVGDAQDKCPNVAEDKNGLRDDDGCPDGHEDDDGDGMSNAMDKCPAAPETNNGLDDTDGCPDEGKSLVIVQDQEIKILEKIYFRTASADILARSFPLLKQVATAIKSSQRLKKVRVEGHSDNVGGAQLNVKLSQRRAESVMSFLVDQGVEPARLEAVGYGDTKPIASNASERGREMNRRVAFSIVADEP